MRSKIAIWTLPIAIMALLAFTFSVFAQARATGDVERERQTTPALETREDTPLESRGETPVSPPVGTMRERTLDGGGTPPLDPGHTMDTESEDIYIYVTLMAPPGPPPPESVVITQVNCEVGSEQVRFKANAAPFYYGADWYHIYRDTVCIFYITQCDSSILLPDRTTSLYFNDNFVDTLWPDYWSSSKGVCDTLVNLFYVFTSVDSGPTAPGGYAESAYPSWPLCEYDQGLKSDPVSGSNNIISIPCYDDDVLISSDLAVWGASVVQEWNPSTQTWSTIGSELFPGTWVPDGNVLVSHSYKISGTNIASEDLFSTFEPGIVPEEDTSYSLYSNDIAGDRNIVMIPFKVAYIDGINDCETLDASITATGATEINKVERWNNASMTWSVIGSKLPFGWVPNGRVRPGLPYRIWVTTPTSSPVTWPIS